MVKYAERWKEEILKKTRSSDKYWMISLIPARSIVQKQWAKGPGKRQVTVAGAKM